MARKLPYTPSSRIRSALRQLWLRSRERAAALKRTNNCCAKCGAKASKAKGREVKLDVHHINGIEWFALIEEVRRVLLVNPDTLEPLCERCHDEIHDA